MLKIVHEGSDGMHTPAGVGGSMLDELAREGARQMLAAALQAEVAAYIDAHADQLDGHGHRLVVRNGYHEAREVATAAGAVGVRAPRVNDKRVDEATGQRQRFASAILPAWARKSPGVAKVLPLLYLHGLSSGDFVPALAQFCGSAAGLSTATITRLTSQWQDEAKAFNARSLAGVAQTDGEVRRAAMTSAPVRTRLRFLVLGDDRRRCAGGPRWPSGPGSSRLPWLVGPGQRSGARQASERTARLPTPPAWR